MPEILYQSHSLEKNSDGISGSLTLWSDSPVSPYNVGDTFRPTANSPLLTVETVAIKDNVLGLFNGKLLRQWEVTISGSNNSSGGGVSSLPETEIVVSREINGSTVRTVTGDLIALRRSVTPIRKKTFTIYTQDDTAITTPGSFYDYGNDDVVDGIVLSENISKETIKNNGVITASYYKHVIEVES